MTVVEVREIRQIRVSRDGPSRRQERSYRRLSEKSMERDWSVVCRKTSTMNREERAKVTRVSGREAVNERGQAGQASRLSLGLRGGGWSWTKVRIRCRCQCRRWWSWVFLGRCGRRRLVESYWYCTIQYWANDWVTAWLGQRDWMRACRRCRWGLDYWLFCMRYGCKRYSTRTVRS